MCNINMFNQFFTHLAKLFNLPTICHKCSFLRAWYLGRACVCVSHQSAVFRMQAKAMPHCLPLANASCLLYLERVQGKRMAAGQTKIKYNKWHTYFMRRSISFTTNSHMPKNAECAAVWVCVYSVCV